MIKSREIEGLYYVNESVRGVYEEDLNGRPHPDVLQVYGMSSVMDFVHVATYMPGIGPRKKILVHGQNNAFKEGFEIASKDDPEVIAVLIPERSVAIAGFIDLVPKPYNPSADLAVIAKLAHARQR